jgi:predicted Rossmann-fold nucleotide-binding protein
VPLFVSQGDKIEIDTRTGEYRKRVFKFHYFALRKMHFMMRAKALVAFPGGFGTLDELFEVLTLVQTGKAKPVPIVLFGTDFWKRSSTSR